MKGKHFSFSFNENQTPANFGFRERERERERKKVIWLKRISSKQGDQMLEQKVAQFSTNVAQKVSTSVLHKMCHFYDSA